MPCFLQHAVAFLFGMLAQESDQFLQLVLLPFAGIELMPPARQTLFDGGIESDLYPGLHAVGRADDGRFDQVRGAHPAAPDVPLLGPCLPTMTWFWASSSLCMENSSITISMPALT